MSSPSQSVILALIAACFLAATVASAQTMNYHEINDRLVTGGHFVDDGLPSTRAEGITVVIDLRDRPPEGQAERLRGLGIEWVNVPVVWKDPRPEDFERFVEAMKAHEDERVLVQCQANYRASAMTYLYRVLVEGVPEELARRDLNAVWEPEGRWREYMDGIIENWSSRHVP